MWAIISKLLLDIVITIVSDKVVVEAGKKLILKGVDSVMDDVGITNKDAIDLAKAITKSGLNNIKLTPKDLGF